MSKLTKAQWRVIGALWKDWQEYCTHTGWEFYDSDNHEWFYCEKELIAELYHRGLLIQRQEPAIIYAKLELTEAGKQLARERFEQQ